MACATCSVFLPGGEDYQLDGMMTNVCSIGGYE
jgi:hypothetical protein